MFQSFESGKVTSTSVLDSYEGVESIFDKTITYAFRVSLLGFFLRFVLNKSCGVVMLLNLPIVKMEESELEDFMEMDPKHRYGHYAEVLGKGSSKVVYRGFDEEQGLDVAWNQVYLDNSLTNLQLNQIYNELNLLQKVRHKNVIRCKEWWLDDKNNNINFITEFFTSGSLKHYCKLHAKHLRITPVKGWMRQILSGLVYLHSQSPPIIHRNLKCDNIFINGNTGQVKIGDMGFSTTMRGAKVHTVLGTPEFMAPEMYEEDYNELVDVYAFGMCVFEMVSNQYPYKECKSHGQIYKKVMAGEEPDTLKIMKNLEVQSFIRKCIAPVSKRPSAKQLLLDPFFDV